jgi:phosphoenolpyruvate-protein kinase (PTS system EI component)
LNEFIFKASDNGQLYIDATNNKVILRPGDNTTAQAAVQQKNEDYTQLLFQLNETTGTGAHGNNVFIHSAFGNGSN